VERGSAARCRAGPHPHQGCRATLPDGLPPPL